MWHPVGVLIDLTYCDNRREWETLFARNVTPQSITHIARNLEIGFCRGTFIERRIFGRNTGYFVATQVVTLWKLSYVTMFPSEKVLWPNG